MLRLFNYAVPDVGVVLLCMEDEKADFMNYAAMLKGKKEEIGMPSLKTTSSLQPMTVIIGTLQKRAANTGLLEAYILPGNSSLTFFNGLERLFWESPNCFEESKT